MRSFTFSVSFGNHARNLSFIEFVQEKKTRSGVLNIKSYIGRMPQPIYASFTYSTLTRLIFGTTKLSVAID